MDFTRNDVNETLSTKPIYNAESVNLIIGECGFQNHGSKLISNSVFPAQEWKLDLSLIFSSGISIYILPVLGYEYFESSCKMVRLPTDSTIFQIKSHWGKYGSNRVGCDWLASYPTIFQMNEKNIVSFPVGVWIILIDSSVIIRIPDLIYLSGLEQFLSPE